MMQERKKGFAVCTFVFFHFYFQFKKGKRNKRQAHLLLFIVNQGGNGTTTERQENKQTNIRRMAANKQKRMDIEDERRQYTAAIRIHCVSPLNFVLRSCIAPFWRVCVVSNEIGVSAQFAFNLLCVQK